MTPRVDFDDQVTAADIARRLGMTRQGATKLTARPGFPAPLGVLGNYTVWSWKQVERWNVRRQATA